MKVPESMHKHTPKPRKGSFCLALLFCISFRADAHAEDGKKLVAILSDISFSVPIPDGWAGDASDAVRKLDAHIALSKGKYFQGTSEPLIRVRINRTTDHQPQKDLDADIDEYRQIYPDMKLRNLHVAHDGWTCVAVDFVRPDFRQSVAYCDPGSGLYVFSFVMTKRMKGPMTIGELRGFREVVRGVEILPGE